MKELIKNAVLKDLWIGMIELLIVSWYLVAWFASPAFWEFLTQPVVLITVAVVVGGMEVYSAIPYYETIVKILRQKS